MMLFTHPVVATNICHPLLWPDSSALNDPLRKIPPDLIATLVRWSEKLLTQSDHPIKHLNSSGKTDIQDYQFNLSREAVKDADHAAILALTYRITHHLEYLKKTREILLSWAQTYEPTGHPINETRLEGLIWAYDLISCDLVAEEKNKILDWFTRIQVKKNAWKYGKITTSNNYRIHQLKILLLLDKILNQQELWQNDIVAAKQYSVLNLNPESGLSIDYLQRNALYYHNYVIQPWLEISLISGCCQEPVNKAFLFLRDKIISRDIGNEFLHSQAKIDAKRARGGFTYAIKGGRFDIKKAAATIIAYYTLYKTPPDSQLWPIAEDTKPSAWIIFLKARRVLWL